MSSQCSLKAGRHWSYTPHAGSQPPRSPTDCSQVPELLSFRRGPPGGTPRPSKALLRARDERPGNSWIRAPGVPRALQTQAAEGLDGTLASALNSHLVEGDAELQAQAPDPWGLPTTTTCRPAAAPSRAGAQLPGSQRAGLCPASPESSHWTCCPFFLIPSELITATVIPSGSPPPSSSSAALTSSPANSGNF